MLVKIAYFSRMTPAHFMVNCCDYVLKVLAVFMLGWPFTVSAQKPTFFPPLPHKLLYADTVYNDALAKKDTLLLAEAYYLYGKTYEATGDYVTSQRWFLKSLILLETRGYSPTLSRLYNRLASNELARGHYKEGLHYSRLALAVAERVNSAINLDRSYSNMANIYSKDWSEGGKKPDLPRARPDSALFFFHKIEQIAHQNQNPLEIAAINSTIGRFLWDTRRNAKVFLTRTHFALDIYTKEKKPGEKILTLLSLSGYYLTTHQTKEAWRMLRQARDAYESSILHDYSFECQFEGQYILYYQLIGDWKKAQEHTEILRQLQVSNFMADREMAFSRLGKEYETEKKEATLKAKETELALRSAALNAQQRFTVVTFVLLVVTAGMSAVFYRLYKKNQRVSRLNELLVREQNHRVKNNLQAVSSLLSLQSEELTDAVALKAIEESRLRVETMAILHRRLYDGKRLANVYLPDFLEELTEGVLNTYGYEEVELDLQADPFYLSADQSIHVGLILNELVTNACKYAFPNHENPKLTVICHKFSVRNQTHIGLTVADNGSDPQASGKNKPGFGMRLIQMETEQLYANYQFTYTEGTRFTMDFREVIPQTAVT
jgi:two-component sensor histidine kinase